MVCDAFTIYHLCGKIDAAHALHQNIEHGMLLAGNRNNQGVLAQSTVDATDITSVEENSSIIMHLINAQGATLLSRQACAVENQSFILVQHLHRDRLHNLPGCGQIVPHGGETLSPDSRESDGRQRLGHSRQLFLTILLA